MATNSTARADQTHAAWEAHLSDQVEQWRAWRQELAASLDVIDESRAVAFLAMEIEKTQSDRAKTTLLAIAINRLARKTTP
jgi:hypothetical protein